MKYLKKIYLSLFKWLYPPIYETFGTAAPISLKTIFFQKVLGTNTGAYWPMHRTSMVSGVKNIQIGIGTAPGLSPGCYIQGSGKIKLGDHTLVAANVGIISANHDIYDISIHLPGEVNIGQYCWIGMNSVILPNVSLGDFTIVGAGSVVTKSFAEGYCVIGGNPAKVIKRLDPEKCIKKQNKYDYHGYIKQSSFERYKDKNLNT